MLKKLACLLALIASPLFAQQTPQAIPLTSGACKLDGTVGCGAGGGGGSGTVTSVAMSGGTTGFSFSGGPITTSGTFTLSGTLAVANGGTGNTTGTATINANMTGDVTSVGNATTIATTIPNPHTFSGAITMTAPPLLVGHTASVGRLGQAMEATVSATYGGLALNTYSAANFDHAPIIDLNRSKSSTKGTQAAVATADTLGFLTFSGSDGTSFVDGAFLKAIVNGTVSTGHVPADLIFHTSSASTQSVERLRLTGAGSAMFNVPLVTSAGVVASFTATPPAAITTAQAGVANTIAASAAVAGSSVAGAAAGGNVNLNGGAAARLTSGNADGGSIIATGGTGIGTGLRGTFQAPGAGASSTAIGPSAVATGANTVAIGNSATGGTGLNGVAIGTSATSGTLVSCIAIGSSSSCTSTNGISVGRNTVNAQAQSIALGLGATTTAAQQMVVGGSNTSTGPITSVYVGSGVTDSTANSVTWNGTGGSGSDNAGASVTWVPGIATGTAASGSWVVKTGVPRATGSTAQGTIVRELIRAKPTTLTESTATAVVTIPVATGKVIGGRLLYTVSATDGTDFQATSGEVLYAAVDKGGTVTVTITQSAETSAASAGTLTSTWTGVANGTNIDLKCNAVSSLTQTVLEVHGQIRNNGDDITGTLTWN